MSTTASECAVTIDGRQVGAARGRLLIDVCREHGIEMPQLCYHPSLGSLQTCDTCWVEVDGELARGCAVTVRDGMRVSIGDSGAAAARREGMDRVLANHELYCTLCDNNHGGCELHNAVGRMHVPGQHYPFRGKPYQPDTDNPFYVYDPDQCILCGRCVEACQNLQVNETLTIDWSLERPRVVWDGGAPIDQSSCVSCGHCVTVCPCNALMEKSMLGEGGPFTRLSPQVEEGAGTGRKAIDLVKALEPLTGFGPIFGIADMEAELRRGEIRRTKTVCTYCGVGCSFDVWTRDRRILKVQPVPEAPANGISTCVKGKFGWDFVNSEDRLTRPLIRTADGFREADWDEALALVARRLGEIRSDHGADALGFIASSKCTTEESYLMQKLARQVIGTNNVDNCSRYCQAPATVGLWRTVGYGGDAGSISDLARAEVLLIVGSNTAESHPVIATRMKRARKLKGQKHIVADPRGNEMARRADLHLQPVPGTDLVWLSALSRYILENGLADERFLEQRVSGLDAYRESLEPYTLDYAEEVTGIPRDQLEEAARTVAAAGSVCGVWAMGVTQHGAGSDTSTAISNLLLVTGNYGRPGTGGYPMRGHNNVQGTSDFGSMPDRFPGYEFVTDEVVRARYEHAWGVQLPATPGFNNHQMVEAVHHGKLRGMYILGEEMGIVDSHAQYVQQAFEKLDFLVVQDVFFGRTAEFADVVLPACPSLEKEGTFVNTERRIQRLYQVMEPLGQSRPDWRILQDVARALGTDWSYAHPGEVMHEAASLAPLFAGVSYERLEGYASQQWPVAADGTGTPLLYTEGFHFDDGMARLYPLEWREPTEQPDDEYDLHLNNGRLLEHFHEGNLTYRSPGIRAKVGSTFVEVSPELAGERGVRDGSLVRLISRRGAVRVGVVVTDRVRGHELYMPMNGRANEEAVNVLTSFLADRDTDTPAYKEVAVRMEVLSVEGEPVLKRNNHRYGHATPASGIQVDRKWQRDDYVRPPGRAPDDGGL
ncbi:MAG TPA: formate dehydrogenase subunit alpha [Gammaproteobacteria bacterium]|nr:formate dehydrogenase subunit alpha [Gammaproteobacteria bacterium]